MPTILVKNTCIEVHGYRWGSCIKLENNFRKYDPLTHTHSFIGVHYDPETEVLYLPRGMDIWYVEQCLDSKAIVVREYNPVRKIPEVKLFSTPRNDIQKEALRFMVGRAEYAYTATKSQLGLYLTTGKGKTYVSVATFAYCKVVPIIIATQSDWLKQWATKIQEYTNITKNEICFLTTKFMDIVIKKKSFPRMQSPKVFLSTHSTIRDFGNEYGWDKLNEFFLIAGIGMKIYDECHYDFKNMWMIDFYTNVWKTYYVSASPSRTDREEKVVFNSVYMRNVPSIDLFDPEEDPHTDYLAIHYSTDPSPAVISACRNHYGLDRNKYMDITINNERFQKMAVIALNMAINKMNQFGDDAQCMIYIGLNRAIETFSNYIVDLVPQMKDNIGIYTSVSSPEEKQIARNKKFIITTTKSAAACVDIDNLRVVIVMCEPFASDITAQQSIGRLRKSDTLYIELVDTGFKQIQRFYSNKLPVFKKYAKSITKKNVPEYLFEELYEKALDKLNKPTVIYYRFEWRFPKKDIEPKNIFQWDFK